MPYRKRAWNRLRQDESGLALIQVLFLIVLLSLLMISLYQWTQTTRVQLDKADEISKYKDLMDVALNEARGEIQHAIEKNITKTKTPVTGINGSPLQFIREKAEELPINVSFEEVKDIGTQKQFSYQTVIQSVKVEAGKSYDYLSGENIQDFGWVENPGGNNCKIVVAISTDVQKKIKKETEKKVMTADVVYELQWEERTEGYYHTQLASMKNIFFDDLKPETDSFLTTNEWIRTFQRAIEYGQPGETFKKEMLVNGTILGKKNGLLVDYQIKNQRDSELQISTLNSFKGSLLFYNNANLTGISGKHSQLEIDNILGIADTTTGAISNSKIKNLSIDAKTGTYFNMNQSSLTVIQDQEDFRTGNLLVTNSQGKKSSLGGLILGRGTITVEPSTDVFSYQAYQSHPLKINPQTSTWNQFMNGRTVIGSSRVYLGPIRSLSDRTTASDKRIVNAYGQFILTNAALSLEGGEDSLSYHEKQGQMEVMRPPSELLLDGPQTKFNVLKGMTWIDAPQKSIDGYQSQIDEHPENWNRIQLKNGAQLDLNFAGMGPFRFDSGKDTLLQFRTLPGLEGFDPTFLVVANEAGQLQGQVVITAYNQADLKILEQKMIQFSLPYKVGKFDGKIENGEILLQVIPSSKVNTLNITRTLAFVENIHY